MASFRNILLNTLLLGALLVCAPILAVAGEKQTVECVAAPDYLAKLRTLVSSNKPAQDYSCLINFPSISKNLKNYQLIDLRKNSNASVKDAWKIQREELRLKEFLFQRPLLLLDDGFSRVQQATDCASLKRAGFTSVKILVGGASQWLSSTQKDIKPKVNYVSPAEFIHEYFHGRVHLVASSKVVSNQLIDLGFTEHHLLQENNFSTLSNFVLSSSGGGFDPVVYVGQGEDIYQLKFNQFLPNLYLLNTGINGLISQVYRDELINQARISSNEVSFCGKK